MVALEAFLKSGQLGPIALGMVPAEVVSVLGDPEDQSMKTNPLVLRYGGLQLTFWRKSGERRSPLRELTIQFGPEVGALPNRVAISGWNTRQQRTVGEFRAFLETIDYLANTERKSDSIVSLIFASGVRATFAHDVLKSLQSTLKQSPEKDVIPLSDEREPSIPEIFGMLDEAQKALDIGMLRASLVMGWAGLEAILRRRALHLGLQGRIGVQPIVLLRELQLSKNLGLQDFEFIDQVRKLRTATAHGLAPQHVDSNVVQRTLDLARSFLASAERHDIDNAG